MGEKALRCGFMMSGLTPSRLGARVLWEGSLDHGSVSHSVTRPGEQFGFFCVVLVYGDWQFGHVGRRLVLLYLAIGKGFEPLLLVPIAFGCLLVNLPLSGIMSDAEGSVGFLRYVYFGAQHEIYPIIIFLGIGALTDFGPLLANPTTFLLGAAAQFGVFVAFISANWVGPNYEIGRLRDRKSVV